VQKVSAAGGEPEREVPMQGISGEALVAIRRDMLRFAQLQLRDSHAAEDVVQEAIEAALKNATTFAGGSTLKTWVFAILKNKIIDHVRQRDRSVAISALVEESDDWDQKLDELFTARGFWKEGMRPASWPDPAQSLESAQFWTVFELCLDRLPRQTARVFMMREFLGFESSEICDQVGLTTTNCHVILHRARMRLRECLEAKWGRPGGQAC
jgi:RNA polymerase sigma-70 factor, ECF subfamily